MEVKGGVIHYTGIAVLPGGHVGRLILFFGSFPLMRLAMPCGALKKLTLVGCVMKPFKDLMKVATFFPEKMYKCETHKAVLLMSRCCDPSDPHSES